MNLPDFSKRTLMIIAIVSGSVTSILNALPYIRLFRVFGCMGEAFSADYPPDCATAPLFGSARVDLLVDILGWVSMAIFVLAVIFYINKKK